MTDFEAMGKIASEDGPIAIAPLTNMIELRKTRQGWEITLGMDDEWGQKVFKGSVVGGLYVMDKEAFKNAKAGSK